MTSNTASTTTTTARPTLDARLTRYRLLRLPEVCAIVGVSRATIYRWAAAGTFPKVMTLSRGVSVIDEQELDAWMARQRQARDDH